MCVFPSQMKMSSATHERTLSSSSICDNPPSSILSREMLKQNILLNRVQTLSLRVGAYPRRLMLVHACACGYFCTGQFNSSIDWQLRFMSLIDNFLLLQKYLCSVHKLVTVAKTLSLKPLDLVCMGEKFSLKPLSYDQNIIPGAFAHNCKTRHRC